jgi:hypothetical protein
MNIVLNPDKDLRKRSYIPRHWWADAQNIPGADAVELVQSGAPYLVNLDYFRIADNS